MPMTTGTHFTSGPALVTWDGMELGISENGVEHQIQQYIQDVHADDFGGTGGAPSDQQWLGATAMVQCVLTKFVADKIEKVINFNSSVTNGTFGQVGKFFKQDSLYGLLIIQGRNEGRSYPCAFARQPVSLNSSARFRRWGLAFFCQVLDMCDPALYHVLGATNLCR